MKKMMKQSEKIIIAKEALEIQSGSAEDAICLVEDFGFQSDDEADIIDLINEMAGE